MDCAGCGRCCDPVWLPMGPEYVAAWLAVADAGGRVVPDELANLRFVDAHMTPLDPQPETYADGRPAETSGHLAWSCDAYDPATRLCTARDERPPICRGFPWYGEPPNPASAELYPACSHMWDLPPEDRAGSTVVGRLLPLWPA